MRCGIGSLELGEVAGFSTTVPNCAKAVGVRSSIGIRIDGHGIEVGIAAVWKGFTSVVEGNGGARDGAGEDALGSL